MKLTWLSDIHLEFLTMDRARRFFARVKQGRPDAVLITGDISTATELRHHLRLVAETLSCPTYFVLGNHDVYSGSFAKVDSVVGAVCRDFPRLHPLGNGEIVPLTAKTALIGHRSWADGRAGLGKRSTIRLNDYTLIADFRELDQDVLFARLQQLGDESAAYIDGVAREAHKKAETLVIGTHVPPFTEVALYEGQPSAPDLAPHFVNVPSGKSFVCWPAIFLRRNSSSCAATLITPLFTSRHPTSR